MGLKTKLAMAVATSAAGAAMIAGGSFALFTASATNANNTFTAGTVQINGADSGRTIWTAGDTVSNLAPGDSGNFGTISIQNTGTLDEWVSLTTAQSGNLFSTYSGAADDTPLQVKFYVQSLTDKNNAVLPYNTTANESDSSGTAVNGVNLIPASLQAANSAANAVAIAAGTKEILLPAGDTITLSYSYNLPSTAGNDYQGQVGQVNFSATATQARNNTADNGSGPQA